MSERALNILFGVNLLGWAVMGIVSASPAERWAAVRVCIIALNALIGMLLIARRPLLRCGSWRAIAVSLPSFLAAGVAFYLAPRPDLWPPGAAAVFVFGAVVAATSFVNLGRHFAVLPAVRGTTTGGLYRFVRHPAFAGELTMLLACVAADPRTLSFVPLAVAIPAVAVRISAEERLLRQSESYRAYADRVTWRLVPGVW